MSTQYARERNIAELAVQRAAILTKTVLATTDKSALSKSDDSPVTAADFGAQALIISAIHHNFPTDTFIGEESAAALRSNSQLRDRVWQLVSSTRLDDAASEELLSLPKSADEMLDIIDLGCSTHGHKGRVWTLDPVDGTKTFMDGGQYAVCLALLEDGQQKVGVLGCPNVPAGSIDMGDPQADKQSNGILISAVSGQGATVRPMSRGTLQEPRKIETRGDIAALDVINIIDTKRSQEVSPEMPAATAQLLGAPWPGTEIHSMQTRFAAIAVGAADVFLCLPHLGEYRCCIWDLAGGVLILEEVGGKVTDARGKAMDFRTGRQLQENWGIVAAPASIHAKILKAVQEALDGSP